jgi:branched-subunit amino acid transport protein
MSYTITILGMALITFVIKAGLFIAGDRIAFPPLVRQALDFVPVTVLTAIVVPMVLAPSGGGIELTWRNPQLVGAVAAVAICALTRHQLLTIVIGLAVFLGWKLLVLA